MAHNSTCKIEKQKKKQYLYNIFLQNGSNRLFCHFLALKHQTNIMAPNLVSSAFEKMFSLEIVENKNDIYLGGASKQMPFLKKTTTTMSILTPLSWLARVSNSCSYSPSPFLSILHILSSQLKPHCSKSFFTHSSHNFFGRPFFLFPVISTSITSSIWELMSPNMKKKKRKNAPMPPCLE